MKLSKAIQVLDINIKVGEEKMPPDVRDALKLGIEAMKRVEEMRQDNAFLSPRLLPGETKD